ncbi:hypothetical protein [Flagellimonas meishanensis]|uniref:hypothetical protein n=1 Tax=Flagellimonas meishanensis TaxID=2873264 RepID=UPI001CA695E6|nr:hypothetical protein [[Muricauda] meishanensis]
MGNQPTKYGWKNSNQSKGCTIYSRKVKDSKFKEFKITGKIDAPLEQAAMHYLKKRIPVVPIFVKGTLLQKFWAIRRMNISRF